MNAIIIPLFNSITDLGLLIKLRRVCKLWKSMVGTKTMVTVSYPLSDQCFDGLKILAIFNNIISFQGAWLIFQSVSDIPLSLRYAECMSTPDLVFDVPSQLISQRLDEYGIDLDFKIDVCTGYPVHINRDFLDVGDYVMLISVVEAYSKAKKSKIHLKIRGCPSVILPLQYIKTLELNGISRSTDLDFYHELLRSNKIEELIIDYDS